MYQLTYTVNSTLTVDNNKVQIGSGDQAPRVVPEVFSCQKSVKFATFKLIILPGTGL